MKRVLNYVICALFIGLMSACSIGQYSSNTVRTADFAPGFVKLDLTMNDFELLGEVKVTVEYRTYFNAINVYETINGEAYNRRVSRRVHFAGDRGIRLSLPIQKATYKVIDQFPNGDYYVPVFTDKQIEGQFLGRHTKEIVTFKVYKQKK
ncbi:MAG: hypothetical protein Q8904_12585 [Bacteroidota bacterium]|nr:hypothetical protein [Bacteroidota bacterium]